MSILDRRLRRVETVSHRRQQAVAPRYDVSDLTSQEQYELALLLDRVRSLSPQEAWAQVPLTPDEQDRLEVLVTRMRVVEPRSR